LHLFIVDELSYDDYLIISYDDF